MAGVTVFLSGPGPKLAASHPGVPGRPTSVSPPAGNPLPPVHAGMPAGAPPHGSLSHLPFTGLPALGLLAVAIVLIGTGLWLIGLTSRRSWRFTMRTKTILALLGAALVLVTGAGTAKAGTVTFAQGVTVGLNQTAGTRQFFLEDLAGDNLTSVNLHTGGSFPFKVGANDSAFDLSADTGAFSVAAVMNNLYQVTGSTYNYAASLPSSDISISFPTNPVSALGVVYNEIPYATLTGTVPSCTTLDALSGLSGNSLLSGATATTAAAAFCTLVGTGYTLPSAATVTGIAQSVTPSLSTLSGLPVVPGAGTTGAFSNADYANGIGASDTAGKAAATNAGLSASNLTLMTGTPLSGSALSNLATGLVPPGTTPTNSTNTGFATISSAISGLQNAGNTAIATLANDISALDNLTQESVILDQLTWALATPSLDNISSLTGLYTAYPTLVAQNTGSAGVPAGVATPTLATPTTYNYQGTLTVTFVQN